MYLDAGYDSHKTRTLLDERGLRGQIAHKGEKAPIQASRRGQVERTHALAERHRATRSRCQRVESRQKERRDRGKRGDVSAAAPNFVVGRRSAPQHDSETHVTFARVAVRRAVASYARSTGNRASRGSHPECERGIHAQRE